ncbi:MAG TPA: tyrosine-type recombinase/integrase [Terriglobales bacterium]|nr:tyrosine-type recombinase/integrase [Terriglobales bacterium]
MLDGDDTIVSVREKNGVISTPTTPNRKRKKCMTFRSGQSGTVVRKGQMWHGRFYVDVPGKQERRKASVPLGSIHAMKKPEAKRKLRAMLQEMGLNDDAHLERTDAGAKTFSSEAAWWKENRLSMFKPSCQETMGSHLEKYLLPQFGSLPMAAIDERRVQEFITDLTRVEYTWPNGVRKRISPKTIRNIIGVLKLIVGEKMWREWKLRLPESPVKEQRCFSPDEMREIVNGAVGQWKVLFATLASTGMRCGEAFGLHVEDLDLANARIYIRRGIWNGEEVSVKTKKGYRAVNIEPALVSMLAAHLGDRKSGRVFQTQTGTPFCKSNVRRKLNQLLKKLNLKPAGLHAFRHGRVSVLQVSRVPSDLVTEWIGHSNLHTTSQYTHFEDNYRQKVACDVALFPLETMEGNLQFSPNSPKPATFAALAGAG